MVESSDAPKTGARHRLFQAACRVFFAIRWVFVYAIVAVALMKIGFYVDDGNAINRVLWEEQVRMHAFAQQHPQGWYDYASASRLAANLVKIDTSSCPLAFKVSFLRYVHSWESFARSLGDEKVQLAVTAAKIIMESCLDASQHPRDDPLDIFVRELARAGDGLLDYKVAVDAVRKRCIEDISHRREEVRLVASRWISQ